MAHRVQLALYDLSRGMAKAMSMAILGKQIEGIWHTGVIVYGKEYFFGGGLQSMPHEQFVAMHGGVGPTEYIDMGATDLPQDLFEDFNREINHRFTAQTYDLLKHNCNNYSNEATMFLLGKGIPQYILDLPNEVLSSPMGGTLRPILEQMTTQMNGADPFAAVHSQQSHPQSANSPVASPGQQLGAVTSVAAPSPAPATGSHGSARTTGGAAGEGEGGAGRGGSYPVLDKHTKPLVGSDTGGAAPNVVARLKSIGSSVDGLLSEGEASLLDSIPSKLAAGKGTPMPKGSFTLVLKMLQKSWPEKAHFLALLLLSLMVLHTLGEEGEGGVEEHRATMTHLLKLTRDEAALSDKSLSLALCTATNMFSTSSGRSYMEEEGVLLGWMDAALAGLQHQRGEVRQMSSALLNNYSLAISSSLNQGSGEEELPDEAAQLLFGALDGLEGEKSEVQSVWDGTAVALRRLLSAGRLLRRLGAAGASLVNEVGLRGQVENYRNGNPSGGEANGAAGEVLRLLSD